MQVAVITLFPEMLEAVSRYGVTGRAVESGRLELKCINPRDYACDKHQTVDDRPYGGGPGMVMLCQPLSDAVQAARDWMQDQPYRVVYLSPQGKQFSYRHTGQAAKHNLILIAGRYEGVDERFIEMEVDEEWSIGDYVLSGGELPAMVVIDALTRRLPGVLGHEDSADQDSFVEGVLDCPHYTRPPEYRGRKVPEVLMSGDHKKIAAWRRDQALQRTRRRRPELLTGNGQSNESDAH